LRNLLKYRSSDSPEVKSETEVANTSVDIMKSEPTIQQSSSSPKQGTSKSTARNRRIRNRKSRAAAASIRKATKRLKKTGILKCEACPASFRTTSGFERHLKLHTSGKSKSSCLMCGWLCGSKYQLIYHMKAYHKQPSSSSSDFFWETDGEEIPYYCDHCHMIFERRSKDIRHFHDAHHGLALQDCSICELQFESKQLLKMHCQLEHSQKVESNESQEILDQQDKAETCPHCSLIFPSKLKLDYHIAKSHKDVLLSCTQCSFKARKYSLLKNHLYTVSPFEPLK